MLSADSTETGSGTQGRASRSSSPTCMLSKSTTKSLPSMSPRLSRPTSSPVTEQPAAQSRTRTERVSAVPSLAIGIRNVTAPEELAVVT